MITIEALKSLGVDTDKGLAMCMGNEALYLKLVNSVPTEKRFEDLVKAIDEGNLDAAFDEDVQRSLQVGMNAHLSKPVEPERLYSCLEELIGQRDETERGLKDE